MVSYQNDISNLDATNYIDWYTLEQERRVIRYTESTTTYPELFISSDDLRKYELAKQSQIKTREIGLRKEKFLFNSKGHLRTQYFNKSCVTPQ